MDKTDVQMPLAKLATSVGTTAVVKAEDIKNASEQAFFAADLLTLSWSNIAAALAAIYTLSMLFEFWWKKFWRPFAERRGWIKPKNRLVFTEEEIRKIAIERELRDRDTVL